MPLLTPLVAKPAPDGVTLEMVTLEFPLLVSVTFDDPVLPMLTLPKLRLVGVAFKREVVVAPVPLKARAVGEFVAAYIRGAKKFGLLTTAKHFPGHGDTATDTHLTMGIVTGDRARLDSVELPPFRRAISAGVDAVMVAHVYVPALDPDPKHVAIISPLVETDLLKNQLGFQGLVVTDALDMNAL